MDELGGIAVSFSRLADHTGPGLRSVSLVLQKRCGAGVSLLVGGWTIDCMMRSE